MYDQNKVKILFMLLGIICIGIGGGMLHISSFGTDPYSVLNLALSSFIGMSFGTFQLIMNMLIFILIFIFAKKFIGVGTIIGMISIAYISDFVLFIFEYNHISITISFIRIILMFFGIIVICFGVALSITANLGLMAYDALVYVILDFAKEKMSFRLCRVMTDTACVLIGFTLGHVIGIAALLMAALAGPLIAFLKRTITDPCLNYMSIT